MTRVMIVPYRNPVFTAKAPATIDVLSHGRLTVGVGVGWLREELEALDAPDFDRRAVIVRTSDFKTNEYARLIGGAEFEPQDENPMLGFRGASRYYDERYAEGFALECQALARTRQQLGLANIKVMIPFCRTVEEARRVIRGRRRRPR